MSQTNVFENLNSSPKHADRIGDGKHYALYISARTKQYIGFVNHCGIDLLQLQDDCNRVFFLSFSQDCFCKPLYFKPCCKLTVIPVCNTIHTVYVAL